MFLMNVCWLASLLNRSCQVLFLVQRERYLTDTFDFLKLGCEKKTTLYIKLFMERSFHQSIQDKVSIRQLSCACSRPEVSSKQQNNIWASTLGQTVKNIFFFISRIITLKDSKAQPDLFIHKSENISDKVSSRGMDRVRRVPQNFCLFRLIVTFLVHL